MAKKADTIHTVTVNGSTLRLEKSISNFGIITSGQFKKQMQHFFSVQYCDLHTNIYNCV